MPIIRTATLKCKYARNTSLPPDEYIVTVGPLGVTGVGHCVEGSGRQGILVHHVEVCAIFLLHQLAQGLLMRCADVLVEGRGDARFLYTYISTRIYLSIYRDMPKESCIRKTRTYSQQGDAFLEGDPQRGSQILDRLERKLLRDEHQLVLEAVANAIEDESEEVSHHLEDFVVVFVYGHLKVQACEFTQMPTDSIANPLSSNSALLLHPHHRRPTCACWSLPL